ncbi:hypothetical protein [Bacillus sp. AFS053548]|uniref:hypothetical protein n=1 Tax=Bacillus sp. AFS053548 TaxID=2033505 RepID=UPI000BFDB263|nr:hypothetical protein [Bacillus sp. AFS053548]PGM59763.1 hypothetical protein CN946_00795 [Bacillus sp. AFS053548]
MYKYSITKYNPSFRNDKGAYLKEDWIAISDIGEYFDGQQLTNESYKKVEDNYIKAIHIIMDYLAIPYLNIKNVMESFSLEFFKNKMKKYPELYNKETLDLYTNVKGYKDLNKENIDLFCRLLLREDLGSDIFYPRRMKVFINYDYLMGVHTSKCLAPIITYIEELGLYVEEF